MNDMFPELPPRFRPEAWVSRNEIVTTNDKKDELFVWIEWWINDREPLFAHFHFWSSLEVQSMKRKNAAARKEFQSIKECFKAWNEALFHSQHSRVYRHFTKAFINIIPLPELASAHWRSHSIDMTRFDKSMIALIAVGPEKSDPNGLDKSLNLKTSPILETNLDEDNVSIGLPQRVVTPLGTANSPPLLTSPKLVQNENLILSPNESQVSSNSSLGPLTRNDSFTRAIEEGSHKDTLKTTVICLNSIGLDLFVFDQVYNPTTTRCYCNQKSSHWNLIRPIKWD